MVGRRTAVLERVNGRNRERTARRRQACKARPIISGRPEIACTIRDLSATGARLSFRNPTILPRPFTLRFDEEDQRVTVVWQAGCLAGVSFQTPIRRLRRRRRSASGSGRAVDELDSR